MTNLDEALQYFAAERAFHRLFLLFRKKYKSLGRVGGSIKVDKLTSKELDAIALFMGMSTEELLQKKTLTLLQFERQLAHTRFDDIGLKELLEEYFDESLVSNKEVKQQKDLQEKEFLETLKNEYPALAFWFDYLLEKKPGAYWIYPQFSNHFRVQVGLLDEAFRGLPQEYERLPMFSQRIAKNPHAFDLTTELGRLWVHLLSVYNGEDRSPDTQEMITDLLQKYNILRDDLLNFATSVNLLAEDKEGQQKIWSEAEKIHMVRNVTLREMLTLTRAYPKQGHDVWLVENSGVCSSLMDLVPQASLVCTHGQVKLATLLLIDLLVAEDVTIHYAGDFDPEGLGMAQRLIDRHPGHVKLWRMTPEDYMETSPNVKLTEDRLKKVTALKDPTLVEVGKQLMITQKAGYQEALVEKMVEDII
ncbi:TIGR02679 family protein [Halobacillus seohaensis]|uniref:TIGR02679 family protein n=1 Tax=Halobacillus seohaensis TaxID=447421 RepID=A0ABW2EJT5_9BACI